MSATTALLGIFMIVVAVVIQYDSSYDEREFMNRETNAINVINMSSSNRVVEAQVIDNPVTVESSSDAQVEELSMEQAPQAEYIPPRVEVYEGMTIEELSQKLDRSLGNGTLAGKGSLIANKCIELGVDPYIAVAIMLHETGCSYSCSNLVISCNNVGGQKGAPSCGGGSYKYYATLDDGIVGHIENLYRNYFSRGYNTVSTIGSRYAESNTWASKINWYVEQIRAS